MSIKVVAEEMVEMVRDSRSALLLTTLPSTKQPDSMHI